MRDVRVMVGIPGSGKTTAARTLYPMHTRVNRDDIRAMLSEGYYDDEGCLQYAPSLEPIVTAMHDAMLLEAMRSGNVVVDNMNLNAKYRNRIRSFAAKLGDFRYTEVVCNPPLEVCLAQNAGRSRRVPERVIRDLHHKYRGFLSQHKLPMQLGYTETYEKHQFKPIEYVPGLPDAIMVDLDGTLCLHNGRNPYEASKCAEDLPNPAVVKTIQAFKNMGYRIIYCTGRSGEFRPQTLEFMRKHGLGPVTLHMRSQGDTRDDAVVKAEMFETGIRPWFNVALVLDDRDRVVQKWREMGLTCFQVAPGDF